MWSAAQSVGSPSAYYQSSMQSGSSQPESIHEVISGRPWWAWLAAAWGILGVAAVLLFAIVRLTPHVVTAISGGLTPLQWSLLVANAGFMAWSEGYRGFQCRFSPRVSARALYLLLNPTFARGVLAPVFCIGYFHSRRPGLFAAWLGTLGIVLAVLLVQWLEQPWRGIVDAGVVVGLAWGLTTFVHIAWLTLREGRFRRSPEVPCEASIADK